MGNKIKVGMSEIKIATMPDILTTIGLGSCVGIIIYDPVVKVAGLAHIMLPNSNEAKKDYNKGKYADTAVTTVLEELKKYNIVHSRLNAKLAGGAQMFHFEQNNEVLKIGHRNVEACRENVKKFDIPIVAEDIGGSRGRTIEFYTETGILLVKTIGCGVKEL